MPALGVDLNGAIRERKRKDAAEEGIRPEVPGAVVGLRVLRERIFGNDLYIISKSVGGKAAERRKWLEERDIFERIGIPPDNLVFCKTRAEKGVVAVELELLHFLDDRLECVGPMPVRHRHLINPRNKEVGRFHHLLDGVEIVEGWPEYLATLGCPLLAAAA